MLLFSSFLFISFRKWTLLEIVLSLLMGFFDYTNEFEHWVKIQNLCEEYNEHFYAWSICRNFDNHLYHECIYSQSVLYVGDLVLGHHSIKCYLYTPLVWNPLWIIIILILHVDLCHVTILNLDFNRINVNLFVPWNNFLLLCEQHSSIEICSSKSSHFEETPSDLKEFTWTCLLENINPQKTPAS